MRPLTRGLSVAMSVLAISGASLVAAAPASAFISGTPIIILTPDPIPEFVQGVNDEATYDANAVPAATCWAWGETPEGPAQITAGEHFDSGHLETATCFFLDDPTVVSSSVTYTVLNPVNLASISVPAAITVEAESVKGANVSFALSGNGSFACDTASGSLFPIGATTVSCSAVLGSSSATGAFTVTVTDPGVVTLDTPKSVTVAQTKKNRATRVRFDVAGNDSLDGALHVSCNHASGSAFKVGSTLVTCTATNSRGKVVSATFTVVVTARR